MFRFGRGVLGGVDPVGYLLGKRSALGVYGGGFPLIYLHKQISQSWGHLQSLSVLVGSVFTVRRVSDCPCNRRFLAASWRVAWLEVSECTTDSLA